MNFRSKCGVQIKYRKYVLYIKYLKWYNIPIDSSLKTKDRGLWQETIGNVCHVKSSTYHLFDLIRPTRNGKHTKSLFRLVERSALLYAIRPLMFFENLHQCFSGNSFYLER